MKSLCYLFLIAFIIISTMSAKHKVTQLTGKKLKQTIDMSPYTLLYIYSSSCKYCQQFTPIFEALSTKSSLQNLGVQFAKIDGPSYPDETKVYEVSAYPTVLLLWKGYANYPIVFRADREQTGLVNFIKQNIYKDNSRNIQDAVNLSPYVRLEEKIVVYYGSKDSSAYKSLALALNRDKFFVWTFIESKEEKIVVGAKTLTGNSLNSISQIEKTISTVFARVHQLEEQPWVRMFLNKQLGLVYVNTEGNKRPLKVLESISKEHPQIVFMNLTPQNPQYKQALKMIEIVDQENIIAVDRKADAVFVAKQPYTKESLTDFIQKVKKYEWPAYRKTQRTTKEEKLTRQNYHEKMNTKQDTVLFLYRRQEKISKSLVELFNALRQNLKDNVNLQFLRCDVSSNQIQEYLGFMVQKTPKLVFYRNRMKDTPIYFSGYKLSYQTVVEFIMENTTFDWKDEWATEL